MYFLNKIISGMRPNGFLHLGHYWGIIKNWLKLQNNSKCLFFIADLHSLTTHFHKTEKIKKYTKNIIIDWLSAGIDPNKSIIFIQSKIPEHSQLFLILSMITSLKWLKHIPTYKNYFKKKSKNIFSTYGFLGYPLLQAADILIYKANKIPIGKDQVPHIEIIKKILFKFNLLYNKKIFFKPQYILSKFSNLSGIDGKKMSNSNNNTIYLREDKKKIISKINSIPTDLKRIYKVYPGNPKNCMIWKYHLIYSNKFNKKMVYYNCKLANLSCLECKYLILKEILNIREIILENSQKYLDNPSLLEFIINDGCNKASKIANKNIKKIKNIIKLN